MAPPRATARDVAGRLSLVSRRAGALPRGGGAWHGEARQAGGDAGKPRAGDAEEVAGAWASQFIGTGE